MARTGTKQEGIDQAREGSIIILDHLTAITNVSVVPMFDEVVLESHTVVVRRGRVLAVLPTAEMVELPSHCLTIDGE